MAQRLGFLFAEADRRTSVPLCKHLASMRRQGRIELVGAPTDEQEVLKQEDIDTLDLLVLLLSPDFLDNDVLVMLAVSARRQSQHLRILPVLLRPCNLARDLPEIAELQPAPRNGKAVTQQNAEQAWYDIAEGIRKVVG